MTIFYSNDALRNIIMIAVKGMTNSDDISENRICVRISGKNIWLYYHGNIDVTRNAIELIHELRCIGLNNTIKEPIKADPIDTDDPTKTFHYAHFKISASQMSLT